MSSRDEEGKVLLNLGSFPRVPGESLWIATVAMSRPETRKVTGLRPMAKSAPATTIRAPHTAFEITCANEEVSWISPFASASCSFCRIHGIIARSAGLEHRAEDA